LHSALKPCDRLAQLALLGLADRRSQDDLALAPPLLGEPLLHSELRVAKRRELIARRARFRLHLAGHVGVA
jgi:hypothetical protein